MRRLHCCVLRGNARFIVTQAGQGLARLPEHHPARPLEEAAAAAKAAAAAATAAQQRVVEKECAIRGFRDLATMLAAEKVEVKQHFGPLAVAMATKCEAALQRVADARHSVVFAKQRVTQHAHRVGELEEMYVAANEHEHRERLKRAKVELEAAKKDLQDEEVRLERELKFIERTQNHFRDEEVSLERAVNALARAQKTVEIEEARLQWLNAQYVERARPWLTSDGNRIQPKHDVSSMKNESGCFAPRLCARDPPSPVQRSQWVSDPYSFVDDVAASHGVKVVRNEVTSTLLRLAVRRLVFLSIDNENGANTRCIVGERGGEKSHLLKVLVASVAAKLPNVVPVYIDSSRNARGTGPLVVPSTLIQEALMLRDVYEPIGNMNEALLALAKHNLSAFIVVDEVDAAYESIPEGADQRHRIRSFGDLQAELSVIANSDTGRCVAYLCGSSVTLPQLIARDPSLEPSYPMLKYLKAPSVTKYLRTWVPSSWTSTEAEYMALLKALHPRVDVTRDLARSTAIVYGCNLRVLSNWRNHASRDLTYRRDELRDEVRESFADVITAVDGLLIQKNANLINSVRAALAAAKPSIANIDVFSRLQGLGHKELLRKLDSDQMRRLLVLSNKGWYSGTGHDDNLLYPASLLLLVVENTPGTEKPADRLVSRVGDAAFYLLNKASERGAEMLAEDAAATLKSLASSFFS